MVVVDTPPALRSEALEAVLRAADYAVLPTPPPPWTSEPWWRRCGRPSDPSGWPTGSSSPGWTPGAWGGRRAQTALMEAGVPAFHAFVRAYKAHERAALDGKPITRWRGPNAREGRVRIYV